jgi:hypothetical protein
MFHLKSFNSDNLFHNQYPSSKMGQVTNFGIRKKGPCNQTSYNKKMFPYLLVELNVGEDRVNPPGLAEHGPEA